MASIEFITKRVEGKKKEIDKLTKKLERIQKAKATDWEVNPYFYSESDLKYTSRDLESAKKALAEYEAELATAKDKAASRNVPAIVEFLNGWKARVTEYYNKTFAEYPKAYDQYLKDIAPFEIGYFEKRKMQRERPDEYREFVTRENEIKDGFKLRFGHLQPYVERHFDKDFAVRIWTLDNLKLDKDLTEEWNRKYDFIIERTNEIVKVITDASSLRVGAKGDLNGFIVGTNGTAKVQTIGAGGYNIQCFHFRTLINRV